MTESQPSQFRLRTLFLVTAAVAVTLALGQAFGWRHSLWGLTLFLNPYTLGILLGNWAERTNRRGREAAQKLVDDLRNA
jgi:hypothetical protein